MSPRNGAGARNARTPNSASLPGRSQSHCRQALGPAEIGAVYGIRKSALDTNPPPTPGTKGPTRENRHPPIVSRDFPAGSLALGGNGRSGAHGRRCRDPLDSCQARCVHRTRARRGACTSACGARRGRRSRHQRARCRRGLQRPRDHARAADADLLGVERPCKPTRTPNALRG